MRYSDDTDIPRADNTLEAILEEYEFGQNPHQSEDYRLNKAKAALQAYIDTKCREARISELRKMDGADDNNMFLDTEGIVYIGNRIAELSKDREGK